MKNINGRVKGLQQKFPEYAIDALLVTKPENIFYLTGFTGGADGRVLVTENGLFLSTDRRYEQQAHLECPKTEIIIESAGGYKLLAHKYERLKKLGMESHHITWQDYLGLKKIFTGALIPCAGVVETLRIIKDEEELNLLRRSAAVNDEVFSTVLNEIKPGASETDIAAMINHQYRLKGCNKEAFDIIALAGKNTALPHGRSGASLLKSGDMITIDMGVFYEHYVSDMTRTFALGAAGEKFEKLYNILREVQQMGIALVKPGVVCKEIDAAIRAFLKKHNLADFFAHSTGHGIGLEIHEEPVVSLSGGVVLQKNMVITVEPGIYIPGWGGIRIEDSVIVKENGCEVITKSPKEFIII
ncbi:MAG: Xaa-Pro peptidase family protein [Syntrophomonadaceae bacterium]|nr:Xaa-Pro peptidase family protein [Syntrophomonadaceae bacterium]